MRRRRLAVVCGVLMVAAQPRAQGPSFEVASVKPSQPGAPQSPTLLRDMLKTLLADRFKLAVREETNEAPIYLLTLASRDGQLGPKLRRSTYPCPVPTRPPLPTLFVALKEQLGLALEPDAVPFGRLSSSAWNDFPPIRTFARLGRRAAGIAGKSRWVRWHRRCDSLPVMGSDLTRTSAAVAAGVGLGAGLMYYFDPQRGSRRRTHLRNQVIHASHRIQDVAGAQLRLLRRARASVDDDVLAERVRAMLGRVASHAHALAIDVSRGVVTVSGPLLRDEMPVLLKALRKVPGVRRVVQVLEPDPAPRRMPRLAWSGDRGLTGRRVAAALALTGLGAAARAAMRPRGEEMELRS